MDGGPFLVVPGAREGDPPIGLRELCQMMLGAREQMRRAMSGDETALDEVQLVCSEGVSPFLNSRAYVSVFLLMAAMGEEQYLRAQWAAEMAARPPPPAPTPESPAVEVKGEPAPAPAPRAVPSSPKCDHAPNLRCKHCVGDAFKRKSA